MTAKRPPRLGTLPSSGLVYRRQRYAEPMGLEVQPLYAVWRGGRFIGWVGRWQRTWLAGTLPYGDWLGWPNVRRHYRREDAVLPLAMLADGIALDAG